MRVGAPLYPVVARHVRYDSYIRRGEVPPPSAPVRRETPSRDRGKKMQQVPLLRETVRFFKAAQ